MRRNPVWTEVAEGVESADDVSGQGPPVASARGLVEIVGGVG